MMNGMGVLHNPSLLTLEYDMELPAATFHGILESEEAGVVLYFHAVHHLISSVRGEERLNSAPRTSC